MPKTANISQSVLIEVKPPATSLLSCLREELGRLIFGKPQISSDKLQVPLAVLVELESAQARASVKRIQYIYIHIYTHLARGSRA